MFHSLKCDSIIYPATLSKSSSTICLLQLSCDETTPVLERPSLGLDQSSKRTRRRACLSEMAGVVPWSDLFALV